jgi:hypothetical protein
MPINKFNTNLDLARQAKIYSGETAVFQGGIEMGMPFSGFPSGVDTNTIVSIGVGTTERATFSGTSATTIFDVTNLSSPSYNPTSTTLRVFPYSEINIDSSVVTVTATTYTPLLLSYTANTGVFNNPTNLVWGNPLLEKLYNNNSSGTTYPNDYFIELFNNIGEGIVGNTIALNEKEYYQTESSNSIYSGGTFNMSIYETGTHGSFPTLVTGTTSGTVTENSATTYFWSDSQYLDETSGMTLPITTLSAATQTTEYDWTLTQSTIIDGNTIGLQYTGFNYTYSFANVSDVSTGTTPEYHGVTFATRENFSAGTLDYKGDLTWLDVKGNVNVDDRLTTNYLTINTLSTGSPVTMLAVDSSGNVVGGSGGTVDDTGAFTSTTANNTILPTNTAGNINDSDFSTIAGGQNNNITGGTLNIISGGGFSVAGSGNKILGSSYSFIGGGRINEINSSNWGVLNGGSGNLLSGASFSVIGGGSANIIDASARSSIGGGKTNLLSGSSESFIGGGLLNTLSNSDKASIVGGSGNLLSESINSFIGGGEGNTLSNNSLYSFIGGGINNLITSGSSYSSIIGSKDSKIDGDLSGTTIVGGIGITATTNDTAYVPNLNIGTVGGGASINNLGIDALGNVVTGTTGGGGAGSVGGTGTTNTITKWLSSTGLTDSNILDDGSTVTINSAAVITGDTTISGITKVNGDETIQKKGYQTLTDAATVTWDVTIGVNAEVTLTGSRTLDITNVEDGDYGTLIVIQDGVGSHTLALDATYTNKVANGGGGGVLLTTTAGAEDIISWTYNGGTNVMYWNVGNDYN